MPALRNEIKEIQPEQIEKDKMKKRVGGIKNSQVLIVVEIKKWKQRKKEKRN